MVCTGERSFNDWLRAVSVYGTPTILNYGDGLTSKPSTTKDVENYSKDNCLRLLVPIS